MPGPSHPTSQPPPGGARSGSERVAEQAAAAKPEPPRTFKARAGRAVAWWLAISIVMLPMGIAYLRRSGGDEAYAVGYAFGTGLVILLVALLAQAVHARVGRGGFPAPLPLYLGVVGLAGIGAQFALRAEDRSNGLAGFTEMVRDCQASDAEPFGSAPAGTELMQPPEAKLTYFRSSTAASLLPGVSADDFVVRQIVAEGRIVALAIAYPGVGADDRALAGFKAGVTRRVAAGGGSARNATVGDADAVVARTVDGGVAVAGNGCWGVAIFAPTQGAAVSLGESLLAA